MKGETIDGDEAVIGLMALKISEGSEFPIFYWKAHYSGPVASYLAAPLHLIWEPSARLLHTVLLPLHIFYACGTYLLARKWLEEKPAFLVGLFAALPAQLFPYSPLGGYTESMAFIPWIFLFCLGGDHDVHTQDTGAARFFIGGLFSGFALWIFPIVFPAVLVCLIFLYRDHRGKSLITVLVGFIFGLLPALYYNLANPGATFLRLFSRPVGLDRSALLSMVERESTLSLISRLLTSWLKAMGQSVASLPRFTLELVGLGHPAASLDYLVALVGLTGLFAGLWVCLRWQGKNKIVPLSLASMVIVNYTFFLFFGMDRWRYLIPVLMMVPFGLAVCLHHWAFTPLRRSMSILVLFILIINGVSAFEKKRPYHLDYQKLTHFLEEQGLTRGYAGYFAAYSLVYLSNERLIYSPAFHTPSADRYPAYTSIVSKADNPAFIFEKERDAHLFRQRLEQLKASFKEDMLEKFTIFYRLSPKAGLKELDLTS
jgi:hypothetical protein